MKPWKIALFILLVMGGLLLATLFSSRVVLEGMRSEDGFSVGGSMIKYPTIETFLGDNNEVVAEVNVRVDTIITLVGTPEVETVIAPPDFSKIDTSQLERISYPGADKDFPQQLLSLFEGESCRILHFGDSQLEGDRISGYLRHRLQGIFGGSGPGFIPVKQVYNQISAEVTVSENWERYAIFDPTQQPVSNNNYGLYTTLSRFTGKAAIISDSTEKQKSSLSTFIRIKPSYRSYPALRRYNHIRMHYGNLRKPARVLVRSNDSVISHTPLIADSAYHCLEIRAGGTPAEITMEFEAEQSPDVYGLTLDGSRGIMLDNIAMRGASGTIFNKLNMSSFRAMAQKLNPKVIIFQYGGNSVPYLKDSLSVDHYMRSLAVNINRVKGLIPQAMIMFIGPGDMSTMINGKMVTYPLLPYLDEKLRETSIRNGWAYWSMYKAMGGLNSMPAWVEQGLAASDYTHFSPKGARIIGELFFTSLYLDLKR